MSERSDVLEFPRRANEIYSRLAGAIVLLGVISSLVWQVLALLVSILRSPRKISAGVILLEIVLVGFVPFWMYLVYLSAKTLWHAFTNRYQPLITLDRNNVVLHRTSPVTVPWADIISADLEWGFRGTTRLLRLGVSDPAITEAGKNGTVISLQSLAGEPTELLAAIQSYPSFRPRAAASHDPA